MKLFGVHIDAMEEADFLKRLERRQIIFTPNPEILLRARWDKDFRAALKVGTLMLPDGNGLQFVSTVLKIRPRFLRFFLFSFLALLFLVWKRPFRKVIPQVVHGSDFMEKVIAWAAEGRKSVYFLGAKKGVAEKVAKVFQRKYGNLRVAGFSSLDPGLEAVEAVKKAKPDVLFVAYGAPKQELWVAKNLDELKEVGIVMAVGGSFDFWSGTVKRAPRFLRVLGLEWFWRLLLNPKQRVKRIIDAVLIFPLISFYDG